MKLIFDQNLSYRLVKKIKESFPESKHISDLRLENCTDIEIWEYAQKYSFCIVTFDADFIDISTLRGFPPKIIWLRLGNTSTDNLAGKLVAEYQTIKDFMENAEIAFLEIK